MDRAREHTLGVARQAQAALAPLADGDAKSALLALATGVVNRAG
jgi:heptaprenyl diphosphate synthase